MPIRIFVILLNFHLIAFCSYGQIVINEVGSDNQTLAMDEDGDFNDWIELYNSGSTAINLANYSLVDNLPSPSQWIFPPYIFPPGSYLLIHASEKNKKEVVDHWETAVVENDTWKYLIPTSEPSATWRLPAFDDASWLSGKGGLGYGDGDDSTVLSTPVNSVYLRKTFTVSDTSKLSKAILHIDYDDGFVAFINGVEIARSDNIIGNPPGYNGQAEVEHEAQIYNSGAYEKYVVGKDLLRSLLVNGENVISVQVHNTNPFSSDLTARANLSFGIVDATTQFSVTPAWFNEVNSSFHTNFKISREGNERIYLFDNSSVLIEQQLIPTMGIDHSFGRSADGGTSWSFFDSATPGASNSISQNFTGYCTDQLNFSVDGGFYTSSQTVTLSGSSFSIKYTTDGSIPTLSSPTYSAPITVSSNTVVRAACMSATLLPEKTFTNTYIINEPTTLPVVCISTDPANFFDDDVGIYMLGPNADSNTIPYFGANFWQDWEKPVHVEFYDKQKKLGFEQEVGVKIFGNYSRSNPMKSLWIKAHDRYGNDRIDYKFFADKNIESFKEIILRNSGNDFNVTHIKDVTNQMAVFKNADIDIQAYEPCVVYINGQYWGVHQIREKINEHYVEQNYAIDKDSIDLLDTWGGALHGESNLWEIWWLANYLDLSDANNFKIIADSFELENMIDYFAAEIYISNWDWPQNNLKLWRPRSGDRRFRYLMYDTDITLGIWELQPASFNQMGRINTATDLTAGPHAEIFSSMLDYIPFRNAFINRSADLMNTIYTPANFSSLAYRLRDSIAPEMPEHFARWGSNIGSWNWNISGMIDFMNTRPAFARAQLESEFNLVKQVDVTLNVSPEGAGVVKINTIYPSTYPWTGVYFDGVPVTITAIPNSGYTFSHWQSPTLISVPNTNKSVSLNVNLDQTFTAYFTGSSSVPDLTVSEVNYNSNTIQDPGDWFELYNNGASAMDISHWKFQDYQDYNCYTFPENTIIQPGGYLVVCSDTSKFKEAFPGVSEFTGPFNFNLSKDGDMLRLFNYRGDAFLSFTYNDETPWPVLTDGDGYTLERVIAAADLNNPASWFSGCLYGSPGSGYNPSCILSTTGTETTSGFQLFPNPTNGLVAISFYSEENSDYQYFILNATGQTILKGSWLSVNSSFTQQVDLSGFPTGLYTIVISSPSTIWSQRLLKQD